MTDETKPKPVSPAEQGGAGLQIGAPVRHVHMNVKGVIRTFVEGWWGVEWSDGSVAVVRPSSLVVHVLPTPPAEGSGR